MAKELKRVLGFWDAVATGLAAMIGAGIFVVSGIGAKVAGSAVILSFVIAGVVALFNALSSAELAAAIPRTGGTYEYARRLISPKVGFMAGWMFISSKMLEAATVALAFGAYISLYMPFDFRLFAVIAVLAITAINVVGIRASTNASKVFVAIKVGALVIFAMVGVWAIKPASFMPVAPAGVTGVLSAAAIVFFAYTGYARIATLGEEIKDPERTIPKAIIVALAITAVVYLASTIVGIGLIGVDAFASSSSPIATAAASLGSPALVALIIIGAGVATISVLLSDLLSSSRTVFAMSRNNDLPEKLSELRNVNPVNSVIVTAAIVLVIVLFGSLIQIAALTSLTILIYYTITNVSSLRLQKEKRRFPKIIPIAGMISCLALTVFLPLEQWLWALGLITTGVVYIIVWGRLSKKFHK